MENIRCNVLLIASDELAVSAHPAFGIDKMVVVAKAPDALLDLGTLLSETLVLLSGRFERVLSLFQAHGFLGGPTRPALVGRLTRAYRVGLQSLELLLGFDHRRFTYRYQGLDQKLTGVEQARVVQELLA